MPKWADSTDILCWVIGVAACLCLAIQTVRFLGFYWYIAPKVFDRWAASQGFRVIQKRRIGEREAFQRFGSVDYDNRPHYVFTIEDREGVIRSGRLFVEWLWLKKLSASSWVVSEIWDPSDVEESPFAMTQD